MLLIVSFQHFLSQLWMINNHFLFSHIVNSLVSVALDRVVILVDLYSQASTSGEVIRLRQVAKAMVLHGLQDVLHAHPLAPLAQPVLAWLWPDLIKTWDNKCSPLNLQNHLLFAVHNLIGDLWLGHVEYLFTIHSPSSPGQHGQQEKISLHLQS